MSGWAVLCYFAMGFIGCTLAWLLFDLTRGDD